MLSLFCILGSEVLWQRFPLGYKNYGPPSSILHVHAGVTAVISFWVSLSSSIPSLVIFLFLFACRLFTSTFTSSIFHVYVESRRWTKRQEKLRKRRKPQEITKRRKYPKKEITKCRKYPKKEITKLCKYRKLENCWKKRELQKMS